MKGADGSVWLKTAFVQNHDTQRQRRARPSACSEKERHWKERHYRRRTRIEFIPTRNDRSIYLTGSGRSSAIVVKRLFERERPLW